MEDEAEAESKVMCLIRERAPFLIYIVTYSTQRLPSLAAERIEIKVRQEGKETIFWLIELSEEYRIDESTFTSHRAVEWRAGGLRNWGEAAKIFNLQS